MSAHASAPKFEVNSHQNSHQNKDSFGQRLIALRKERDMTQVQLAKATQVTQRAISYYETDGGSPQAW
ncbi:MAG: helix-turn-helix transcriptional regulator [Acidobacteriota bacterium]|nr:helix-turn-helix transcriptional regulator [Acidobacteriota bacterium]